MIRHMIPRLQVGRYSGSALTDDFGPDGDEVRGFGFCCQWFGILIEVCVGGVR
ncbi:hypothetical protein [Sphingomonas sp. PAMC 26621]|uniref:hypothetical protein n=1 Tax=Sphingomonas sp. PAMC 26621 TaxID=1112213 RepID=UPI001478542D|nr:hypothetical protein [Sphingomonas sp. PAMC 26621]